MVKVEVTMEVGADEVAIIKMTNPLVNALAVTRNGGKFSGGFDINVLQEVQQTGNLSHLGRVFVDLMINTIEEAKKPSVAAIQGLALGGGLELAMSCHARISTPKAQLGFPELQLGIIPGFGGCSTFLLPTRIVHALNLIVEDINCQPST